MRSWGSFDSCAKRLGLGQLGLTTPTTIMGGVWHCPLVVMLTLGFCLSGATAQDTATGELLECRPPLIRLTLPEQLLPSGNNSAFTGVFRCVRLVAGIVSCGRGFKFCCYLRTVQDLWRVVSCQERPAFRGRLQTSVKCGSVILVEGWQSWTDCLPLSLGLHFLTHSIRRRERAVNTHTHTPEEGE